MNDIFESDRIYHIYNRAVGEEKLFRNDDNYLYFLQKYHQYLGDKVDTLAYCLIPNHFHFLVKVKSSIGNDLLVKSFSDFQNSYSKSFNKAFNRHGALFQRKFKRKKVDAEDYLSRLIIYIHLNPVKHQIARNHSDWKYSSFGSYLSQKPSKLNRELVLEWFDGLEGFKDFHQVNSNLYLPEEITFE